MIDDLEAQGLQLTSSIENYTFVQFEIVLENIYGVEGTRFLLRELLKHFLKNQDRPRLIYTSPCSLISLMRFVLGVTCQTFVYNHIVIDKEQLCTDLANVRH
jgi:hypothetical protein